MCRASSAVTDRSYSAAATIADRGGQTWRTSPAVTDRSYSAAATIADRGGHTWRTSPAVTDRSYSSGYSMWRERMGSHYLQRLDRIVIEHPVFYVTVCTQDRQRILADAQAAAIMLDEWRSARERHGWMVGRYVIMPNHVHFFCAPGPQAKDLSAFMLQWKQWTSKRIVHDCGRTAPIWQHGFFDHLLRSDESYEQKWLYVCANPVRAGLVARDGEWPWEGEVCMLA